MTLRLFSITSPSAIGGRVGSRATDDSSNPVSSANSRAATDSRFSSGSARPFGIVQLPTLRRSQNGPPGWARSTSRRPACRRNRRIPAERGLLIRRPAPSRALPASLSVMPVVPDQQWAAVARHDADRAVALEDGLPNLGDRSDAVLPERGLDVVVVEAL